MGKQQKIKAVFDPTGNQYQKQMHSVKMNTKNKLSQGKLHLTKKDLEKLQASSGKSIFLFY